MAISRFDVYVVKLDPTGVGAGLVEPPVSQFVRS
jgi:hypothetical protein